MAKQAKAVLETEKLDAVADRGYFSSLEILACHQAAITAIQKSRLDFPNRAQAALLAISASTTIPCSRRTFRSTSGAIELSYRGNHSVRTIPSRPTRHGGCWPK
jgi:hypothetical protein